MPPEAFIQDEPPQRRSWTATVIPLDVTRVRVGERRFERATQTSERWFLVGGDGKPAQAWMSTNELFGYRDSETGAPVPVIDDTPPPASSP